MYYKNNHKKIFFAITLIVVGTTVLFFITGKLAKDTIVNNIKIAASNTFIDVTNNAVSNLIDKLDIDYNELANIQTDNNGNIVSVTCNTIKLTQIKSMLYTAIQEHIKKDPSIKFYISLGNFTGNEYLAGRGPKIPFEYSYDCVCYAEYRSEFSEAGINQTIHRIILDVSTDISTVIPWSSNKTNIQTSYIIAETIIIGNVPTSYTYFNLDDLNKMLNNY